MSRRKSNISVIIWLKLTTIAFTFLCQYIPGSNAESILLYTYPTTVKQLVAHYKPKYSTGYLNENYRYKRKDPIKHFQAEKVFKIEPSDAIDVTKYSHPAIDHPMNLSGVKVPLMTLFKARITPVPNLQEQTSLYDDVPKINTTKPMRDLRFIETLADKSPLGVEYKYGDVKDNNFQADMGFSESSSDQRFQNKNNFTDDEANLLPVSSDAILSYKVPSIDIEKDNVKDNTPFKVSTERVMDISSHYSENKNSTYTGSVLSNLTSSTVSELSTETSIEFNTHQHIGILNKTDSLLYAITTITPSMHDEANFSSDMPLLDSENEKLSSGTVAGIVIAVLVCVTLLSSAVIYLLYRKYNGKCTSVVEGKFNTDNCGYLDDSLRSSIYLNNHIELPKESSEEMSSLDNDSFLNSLETMTIQNYWADNSKNTKV